jgi:hypothetical protein
MTNPTSEELVLQFNMLKEKKIELTAERNGLPRNDKQNAHRLYGEICSIDAEMKRLKPAIRVIRAEESARESHAMWVMAVRELFGMEALTKCYEFMRNERKFRDQMEG